MRKPSFNTHARRAAARMAFLLLPLAFLTGCDLITGSELTVEGTWVGSEAGQTVYLEITNSTVTVYEEDSGDQCYAILELEITNQEGDEYTLSFPGESFSFTLIFRIEDDRLAVLDAEDPEAQATYYDSSDEDVSQFEECAVAAGGGDDPSITCSALPSIDVGQSITGELTTSDDSYESRYFDLYGLNLGSSQQVQIDLMSEDIDTYLYVYEDDGTYVAENDDGGEGFNSSLTITIGPGCFRLEATSWGTGETGFYTISVN